jgi:hypothetical protein
MRTAHATPTAGARRWRLGRAALVAGLALGLGAAPARAETVSATGQAQAPVRVSGALSQAKIVAAVQRARAAAVTPAAGDAWLQATRYAEATGLQLTAIQTVAEPVFNTYGAYYGGSYGRFGPGIFCGEITSVKSKVVNGKRKVISRRKVQRCYAPTSVAVSLTLTYSAIPAPPVPVLP